METSKKPIKAKLLREREGFDFKKGDIVIIKENGMPKSVWDFVGRYKIEDKGKNRSPPIKEIDVEILS